MMEELSCKSVRQSLWDYATQAPGKSECDAIDSPLREAVDSHLSMCRDCGRSFADVSSLRTGFRHLPTQAVPPLLNTRLKVIASRERSRQLLRLNPAAWLHDQLDRFLLSFDRFLRPYAVPATGGLLASCLCFSLIAHSLQLRPYLAGDFDMPIGIYSEIAIDDVSPFSLSGKDVTVQVTVDANGNVANYSTLNGTRPTTEEFESIGGFLLYSTFTPAMRDGQRVSSKRLIAIHHLNFDSRGVTNQN